MNKHKVEILEYDDGSGTYYGCVRCGLFMGIIHGELSGRDYSHLDKIYSEDGECPGQPIGDVIVRGFQEFWISPGFGGDIRDSIRRLYGGSGHLCHVEKVTKREFEKDYGLCLAIKVWEGGELEAITDVHIVQVHEYDGSEWLESVERTPKWFRELEEEKE